jgi:hypothetical protein
MGYSCRQDADDTYRQWVQLCVDATGKSNVYVVNGVEYVIELGREQRDGAMTGSVSRLTPNGEHQWLATTCGSFRIEPDGTVKRYPIGMKKLLTPSPLATTSNN